MLIVCLSCHFGVGLHLYERVLPYHGARGTPLAVLDDTCILTMTRTYLGPKLSRMRFRYSYSRGMRFSTCDLQAYSSFWLTLILTIEDAYDRGNESSKLISTILFWKIYKTCLSCLLCKESLFYFYVESSSSNFKALLESIAVILSVMCLSQNTVNCVITLMLVSLIFLLLVFSWTSEVPQHLCFAP